MKSAVVGTVWDSHYNVRFKPNRITCLFLELGDFNPRTAVKNSYTAIIKQLINEAPSSRPTRSFFIYYPSQLEAISSEVTAFILKTINNLFCW